MVRYFLILFLLLISFTPPAFAADYKTLFREGRVAERNGDYETAIKHYQQAIAQTRVDKPSAAAAILFWLGGVYQQQRQYGEAETAYQASLQLREAEHGPQSAQVAVTLNNLGGLYYELGDYEQAAQLYQRALTIDRQHYGEDAPKVAIRLNNLAEVYRTQANYRQAEALFLQALAIDRAVYGERHPNVAIRLNNLAELYRLTGDYAQAKKLLQLALEIDQAAFDQGELSPASLGIRLNNLAQLHRTLADYATAAPLYQQALTHWRTAPGADSPTYAIGLNNIGWLHHLQHNYDAAEKYYQQALALVEKHYSSQHPERARHLNNLGLLHLELAQYDSAEALLTEALTIWETVLSPEHPAVAATLTNLARLARARQQLPAAENYLRRALAIVETLALPALRWHILDILSQVLAEQNALPAAILLAKQSVNTLQELRANVAELSRELQRHFIHDKTDIYRRLADWLVDEGRLSEAQQVLMMLKEEEFFDFVRRDQTEDSRTLIANYTAQETPWVTRGKALQAQFADLGQNIQDLQRKPQLNTDEQAQLQQLRQQADQALEQLNVYFAELKQAMQQTATQTAARTEPICLSDASSLQALNQTELGSYRALQATLRQLGQGVVILHYVVTERKVRIILTTAESQICRETELDRQTLNNLINDFREKLQTPQYRIYRDAQQLYQHLFAPIADDLVAADAKVLMLSLDGNLRYLPIGALFNGRQFVAQHYQLALFTDVARDKINQKPAAAWRLAGLGLTQRVRDFNPLPAVKMELEGIVRQNERDPDGVLPGIVRLDNAFNLASFQETLRQKFPVVHLASHFVFDPTGTDQSSYLLLGDGTTLTLAQVRNQFDFSDIDLLTLSACETGMGNMGQGREIEGLGALAQRQGAKGVIATLWPVDDESTGAFMQHLYRVHTETPNLTKAAALQQAQVAFITARRTATLQRKNPEQFPEDVKLYPVYYDHPYYWAPFVLMGNWL